MEIPKEGKRGEIEGEGESGRERSLLEVAIRGDTRELLKLLQVDEGILNRATTTTELLKLLQEVEGILNRAMTTTECTGNDNPLHLAALYGHVDFAREIVSRKWELARGLNSKGQSPLHVASARGHVGVVKEILGKDAGACFVRDQDGMIPLHAAAIKGRYEVMKELVNANITTAFVLTDKGEPILHVCANYNQFEAIKKLVELVKDDDFLKLKDSNDDTILHLLAHKGENKVIEFLTRKTSVDVNVENANCDTPLDVSLVQHTNWRTNWILVGAGAKRGKKSLLNGRKRNYNEEGWFYEALLVVAALMVTVAFQSGINPPGGVWQDTPPSPSPSPSDYHHPGRSIMMSEDDKSYNFFYVLNIITLFSSLSVIGLVFLRRVFRCLLLEVATLLLVEVPATALTYLSIMTLSASAAISFLFVSSSDKYFGPQWDVYLAVFLVIFSIPSLPLLLVYGPPNFQIALFEALWFLNNTDWRQKRRAARSGLDLT